MPGAMWVMGNLLTVTGDSEIFWEVSQHEGELPALCTLRRRNLMVGGRVKWELE